MKLTGLALASLILLAGCTAAAPSDGPTTEPGATDGPAATVESVYYPVAEGNTWVYSIDYGDGMLVTDTEVMTAVVPDAGGARVTIERTFVWDDGSQPDVVSTVDYVFGADGSIRVPFQSIPSAGGATVTVESGTMTWPTADEFEAGTAKTGTIEATVETSGSTFAETIDFAITGAGTEDVTVPAGSYTARKLVQQLVISLPDLGVSGLTVDATTWIAEGVGPVRTEVPDTMGGGTTIVQVLKSFTPGR
ncbi:MAG: hypothetical protein BGO97_08445 [Micrococcales bacterium 70-64]|mgnify:CR=1 FL=1|nr:hypothetical protein [Leifsonia sp.]ODU64057.1 MAG: hypothetical protein ABT06_08450 [Leifsonia sp. SCN 70-46]OJX85748.1 MAG: hypothetical protein BGO97_08445 [Micrococcales bacterium 70-64]